MKKLLSFVLATIMVLGCVAIFGGCGGKQSNSLSICLASDPATIDPALNSSVDGATMIIHAFSGLVAYNQNESGALELVPELATEIPTPTIGEDGKATYVFTLKDDLKWSNGEPLTAEDFVWSWNRAADPATGADYSYMFDVIDGYAEMQEMYVTEEKVGEDGETVTTIVKNEDGSFKYVDGRKELNVKAEGNKITVVLNNDVPYFIELCAFPTYLPVYKATVEENGDAWATTPDTYVTNGAYVMTEWTRNSRIVFEKNDNYYNADAITMDKIEFYLSDDSTTMLANYKTGDWIFIDDVPSDEIATLKEQYPNEFVIGSQIGTYYVCFNTNYNLLPEGNTLEGAEREKALQEIRNALSLLLDRDYICVNIGQAGQEPASSFVALGITDADTSKQFYKEAGSSEEYFGYFDPSKDAVQANIASALETLKKYYAFDDATGKFTNFPSIEYLYNTSDAHKLIGEYIQSAFAQYGITMTLTNQEWNTFLDTRKNGDYTIARNGWLADYNDPISFLDMWITESGNNDVQFGKGANATVKAYSVDLTDIGIDYKVTDGTWAETFDYIIALSKAETNKETRYKLLHKAEDLLMSTGCITPLYYYTDIYMCSPSLEGSFTSPLGYKYFMYSSIKAD